MVPAYLLMHFKSITILREKLEMRSLCYMLISTVFFEMVAHAFNASTSEVEAGES